MIIRIQRSRKSALCALALLALAPSAFAAPAAPAKKAPAAKAAPTKPIVLFNGKDLSNWVTWLSDHGFKDPNGVFRVVDRIDGAPAIRMSGEGFGGIVTKESYSNYHMVVEFRWGSITWAKRMDRTMDSGILVHAQGREGGSGADFKGPWMYSIEYQLIEGGTGDFIRVGGYDESGKRRIPTFYSTVSMARNGQYNYDPNGERVFFDEKQGRTNWYGRDSDWKDVLGFRGAQDVENPVGQWNKVEIICKGDTIISMLNGKIVNKATECSLKEGRILFQTEGAEIFFRRIELYPLK